MLSIESASSLYQELTERLNTKGVRSLNNVRMACDLIVAARGIMNYSRVAEIATAQFGGPMKQSVHNNNELKRYIAARMAEYYPPRHSRGLKNESADNASRPWPEEGLSVRTKTYITQLQTRLEMVEKRYRELRIQQEKMTKACPVNLARAIEDGAVTDVLHIPKDGPDEAEPLREAIVALMKAGEYISALQTETHHARSMLILKRPSGDIVILTPAQLECLTRFIHPER